MRQFRPIFAVILLVSGAWSGLDQSASADESLKDIACRSVHLGYSAEAGTAFCTEVTIEESAPGTYFMVCGWDTGYFGLQELGDSKKVVLFSVWDNSHGDDPAKVDPKKRVRMLHKDDRVRVGRFGGEGTGGQAFLDFDWQVGQTYHLAVAAKVHEDRTEYAGYLFLPDKQTWLHLVTFSTVTGGKPLAGYYSFLEDFRRNKESARQARRAQFGNAWVQKSSGDWFPVTQARFTGDANPVLNIDAGKRKGRFFLATGGGTENSGCKLNELIELPANDSQEPPNGLKQLLKPRD